MEHYIDKDALVAEIERKADIICQGVLSEEATMSVEYFKDSLISFLDTLEVKEVDLQSEIDCVWDNTSDKFSEDGWKEFEDIAKHFFELGIAVSNKAQKGE